ncbi:hypothetical protein XENTR_v10014414 [Xenopus tropicalis]|nr:hypothetical protein XENTR_v10014414 [Xenopus tropicalis]
MNTNINPQTRSSKREECLSLSLTTNKLLSAEVPMYCNGFNLSVSPTAPIMSLDENKRNNCVYLCTAQDCNQDSNSKIHIHKLY